MYSRIFCCVLLFFACFLEASAQQDSSTRAHQMATIQQVFAQWVVEENKQHYCSKEDCASSREHAKEGNSSCGMRLSEELDTSYLVWGDMNGDGVEDAYVKASYEQCDLGTWFVNVAAGGHVLFFLSDNQGSYTVLNQPKMIVDNIGVGHIHKIEKGKLYAKGMFFSGEHLHEIDLFWEATFEYKNNQFKLLHKSSKEKKSYQD